MGYTIAGCINTAKGLIKESTKYRNRIRAPKPKEGSLLLGDMRSFQKIMEIVWKDTTTKESGKNTNASLLEWRTKLSQEIDELENHL